MEMLSRDQVLNKLNKLKAFIERDCGHESVNAQQIADRLIKKYGITSREFTYVHFSIKHQQDAARATQEKAHYEQRARQAQETKPWRLSYTSLMREVVIAFCDWSNIRYSGRGGKIYVFCSAEKYAEFSRAFDRIKARWSESVKIINKAMIDGIERQNKVSNKW